MSADPASMPAGLSVFFPAYNDSGTIASMVIRTVKAAAELTPDFEIIIVDDGSGDGTADIADELAHTYPQVRASSSAISAVPSALPSSTTMTSKSGVSSEAVLTARITMLAMVPLSLYAGKKMLRPAGVRGGAPDMSEA